MANGTDVKWMGLTVDKWVGLLQTVGIPTMFMLCFCLLAWKYVPPVVQGHLQLLERNGDTMDSMDETMQEIVEVERDTKDFMQEVKTDHAQALEDHRAIIEELRKE